MNWQKFAITVVAFTLSTSVPAFAQGGGAAGTSGAGTAPSGSAQTPTATQPSEAPFQNSIGHGTAPNANQTNSQVTTGQAAIEPRANAGVGHAPNGLPIGSTGSGPGSPEQPINSGSR
jgi:hypothetical protein